MLDPMESQISRLARSLARARSGEDTNADIVRWLRAYAGVALSIPVPKTHDARRDYSRTLLHRCDGFEVLALHWQPGARSAIHDHGGALCWFAVALGEVGVENFLRHDSGSSPGYARIGFDGRSMLETGAIDYRSDDLHLHRCYAGDRQAITLHVYARPLDRFYTFDERAETCSVATSTYDAILDASLA
jgi:cysteine dioxygenase